MKDVLSLFGDLFEQKNFFAILLLLICVSYIEERGDFIYIASLEYKINVLQEMSNLSSDPNIQNNFVLRTIYTNYLNEFSQRKALPMNTTEALSLLLLKFLTGATFGIIYSIIALRLKDKKLLRGALAIAYLVGGIGMIMPIPIIKIIPFLSSFSSSLSTIQGLGINLVILFISQFVILMIIGGGKRKAKLLVSKQEEKKSVSKKKNRLPKTKKLRLGDQRLSTTK
ncbi:MAG TPA: hypothetical protein DIW23_02270 [Anaerolineae bacterium]|nr:hypothetical protein [Anaerolineae bacterium]